MEILNTAMLWLHTLAAVAWIGGMIFNLFVLRPSMGAIDPDQRIKLAVKVLNRFLTIVWISVGALILTGILIISSKPSYLKALFGSPYGNILLFKLAVVLVMVLIVTVIRYVLLPRLESMIAGSSPDVSRVMGQMLNLVKINLGLGVLVLLLSGFLAYA